MSSTISTDLVVNGSITASGGFVDQPRSSLKQDNNLLYTVDLASARVHDSVATVLPGTAATDDLELTGDTYGTDGVAIETGDLKAAGATTRYARFSMIVPAEYVSGESVTIRARAGMVTTVADTTATIDFEARKVDTFGGVGSDLVTTTSTSINSLTDADFDFQMDASTLVAGDVLDVRVAVAINDAATGTAVIGRIGKLVLLCDVKG